MDATEEEAGGKATNGVSTTEVATQPEQEEEEEDEDGELREGL